MAPPLTWFNHRWERLRIREVEREDFGGEEEEDGGRDAGEGSRGEETHEGEEVVSCWRLMGGFDRASLASTCRLVRTHW